MRKNISKAVVLGATLSMTVSFPLASSAEPHTWHAPHGQMLDDRHHHGYFYPRPGVVVTELPVGYRTYWFHGANWYFAGGVWYQARAGGFIVARPPVGIVVTALPPYVTTLWIGGIPYYYADDIYYRWDPATNGYEVVAPPEGADQPGAAPARSADDLIVYPRNGQSQEQQSADRYECHRWAGTQSGFDPTKGPGSAVQNDQYRRAMSACLEARGYSVK